MAVERIAPDAILEQSNLSGTLAAIGEDVSVNDGQWLTAPGGNTATAVRVSFGTPADPLTVGAGLQTLRARLRKTLESTDPSWALELYEAGLLLATLATGTVSNTTAGVIVSGTWDATGSVAADIECRIAGTPGGGSPGNRASLEVGAIEWLADTSAATPPEEHSGAGQGASIALTPGVGSGSAQQTEAYSGAGLPAQIVGSAELGVGAMMTEGTLFAEYGFDEGTGTTVVDSSGNGRDLTIGGGAWVTGHTDDGLQSGAGGTDGAQRATAGPTAAITLMCWVKPSALTTTAAAAVFGGSGNATMAALFTRRNDFGPSGVVQGNVRVNGSLLTLNGGDSAPVDAWTHLALTFNGTSRALYVNGSPVDTQASAGTIGTATKFAVAGWNDEFNGSAANLTVDDVRVFDAALTESEINTWMETPVGGATPDYSGAGLAASISLNPGPGEGTATQTEDYSGLGVAASVVMTPGIGQGTAEQAGNYTGTGLAASVVLTPGVGQGVSEQAADYAGSGLAATVELVPGLGVGSSAQEQNLAGSGLAAEIQLTPGLGVGFSTQTQTESGDGLVASLALTPGLGIGFIGAPTPPPLVRRFIVTAPRRGTSVPKEAKWLYMIPTR